MVVSLNSRLESNKEEEEDLRGPVRHRRWRTGGRLTEKDSFRSGGRLTQNDSFRSVIKAGNPNPPVFMGVIPPLALRPNAMNFHMRRSTHHFVFGENGLPHTPPATQSQPRFITYPARILSSLRSDVIRSIKILSPHPPSGSRYTICAVTPALAALALYLSLARARSLSLGQTESRDASHHSCRQPPPEVLLFGRDPVKNV